MNPNDMVKRLTKQCQDMARDPEALKRLSDPLERDVRFLVTEALLEELEPSAPPAPNGTRASPREPGRDHAQILSAYRTNLEWAIDCASLKLNRLKPGSSAYKTQAGIVRGLQEAKGALDSEEGS